jgi:hypothetical protein
MCTELWAGGRGEGAVARKIDGLAREAIKKDMSADEATKWILDSAPKSAFRELILEAYHFVRLARRLAGRSDGVTAAQLAEMFASDLERAQDTLAELERSGELVWTAGATTAADVVYKVPDA